MSETIQLKMAKASRDDFDRVIKFFNFIEEYMEYGTHTPENEDFEEESIDLDDEKFVEMLRTLWGGRFKPPGVYCMWSRVVFGCQVLIENVCDPSADTLEWKPELAAKLEPNKEKIDEILGKIGVAINVNDGRCPAIEDALVAASTYLVGVSQ